MGETLPDARVRYSRPNGYPLRMSREAVIVDIVRTPIGKRKGALAGWHPTDLLAFTLQDLVRRTGVDPERVDDVIGGCVTQVGEQGCNVTRNAWVAAGLPQNVAATSVDRQCGSSQQAVHFAAQGVIAGSYDLAIACGVESMTRAPMASNASGGTGPVQSRVPRRVQRSTHDAVRDRADPRRQVRDQPRGDGRVRRAESIDERTRAPRTGSSPARSCPCPIKDADGNETGELLTRRRGHPARDARSRSWPTLQSAGQLGPAIGAGDHGRQRVADERRCVGHARGRAGHRRGAGPAGAGSDQPHGGRGPTTRCWCCRHRTRSPASCSNARVCRSVTSTPIECNEAFAADRAHVEQGVPARRSIATTHVAAPSRIGHPLGASGVRIMGTLLNQLETTGGRLGFQTMCEGGGQANATVIERLD